MTDSFAKRRTMYKMTSPLSWKDNYKQRCAVRLKNSREKLLNKFRNTNADVDEIMTDELQAMQEELSSNDQDLTGFDDVLRCMEQIKFELLEWETELMLSYESEMVHDELEIPAVRDEVICPVCKLHCLKVHFSTLHCDCGLLISTDQDSLSLANVKAWLEEGVVMHSARCLRPPIFSVVKQFRSTSHLLITCSVCDYMFIVI